MTTAPDKNVNVSLEGMRSLQELRGILLKAFDQLEQQGVTHVPFSNIAISMDADGSPQVTFGAPKPRSEPSCPPTCDPRLWIQQPSPEKIAARRRLEEYYENMEAAKTPNPAPGK